MVQLVKFSMVPLGGSRTHAIQGSTNGTIGNTIGTNGTIGNDRLLPIMQTIYSMGKITNALKSHDSNMAS